VTSPVRTEGSAGSAGRNQEALAVDDRVSRYPTPLSGDQNSLPPRIFPVCSERNLTSLGGNSILPVRIGIRRGFDPKNVLIQDHPMSGRRTSVLREQECKSWICTVDIAVPPMWINSPVALFNDDGSTGVGRVNVARGAIRQAQCCLPMGREFAGTALDGFGNLIRGPSPDGPPVLPLRGACGAPEPPTRCSTVACTPIPEWPDGISPDGKEQVSDGAIHAERGSAPVRRGRGEWESPGVRRILFNSAIGHSRTTPCVHFLRVRSSVSQQRLGQAIEVLSRLEPMSSVPDTSAREEPLHFFMMILPCLAEVSRCVNVLPRKTVLSPWL